VTEHSEPISELALVRAAAAGDSDAFEKLYQQHYKRVYAICLRMLGNPAQAEDITQEVFLLVYRKLDSFRGESAFTTWLHRLAVNQVLMYLRKRGIKLEQTVDDEQLLQLQSERRVSVVDRIALEKAISELPPGYRTVFVLHDVEGFEHLEISRMLGISIGTSKSQLHKARMRLRDLLSKEADAYGSSGEMADEVRQGS
jgi:RNA polymerase sigma-70 factor (ECF subfamily)